ncbi:hypothetical protein F5051DRAFT_175919 [Lentinula edodes]|nr:hypothetical protein F5051DRAFT_175919 [Lentinula edodes]
MTGANNPALRPMNSPPPRVASPRSSIRRLQRRSTWSSTALSLFWSTPSVSPLVPPTPSSVSTASTMRTSNLTTFHQKWERWDPTRKRRERERESYTESAMSSVQRDIFRDRITAHASYPPTGVPNPSDALHTSTTVQSSSVMIMNRIPRCRKDSSQSSSTWRRGV